ncbi:hypothetical protein [Mycoplasmopsis agassizii]|uniref:Uncharacterized protein n=1 Tax=Mycoplasmopsis agassizii TaxID=33922 RepID=A0ABX4H5N0_9BACT|nr:hypothetical protein [Mycoplasmopsis agassizii]PAF55209.1 hypothetical protein CJF60_00790 [Mycoplasmopsis agassizii]SMC18802.1 oligopeptide transport system substrate-binding protein [Mycoplasmopsis agassizii]
MKLKNKLILGASALSVVAAATTLIACSTSEGGNHPSNKTNTGLSYDLGLSTIPLNNLNYIKNKSTFIITPTFIEGFIKNGPTEEVKNAIGGMPKLNIGVERVDVKNLDQYKHPTAAGTTFGNSFYPYDTFGMTTGVAEPTAENQSAIAIQIAGNNILSMKLRANNGQSTWATYKPDAPGNKDSVTPQDFIDSAQYILDINSGSQYLTDFLNLNIKNAQKVVDAQNAYVKKHKVPYSDPFNRKKVVDGKQVERENIYETPEWESQVEGDEKEVEAIKQAVLGLGIYTGDFGPIDIDSIKPDEVLKPTNRYADPRQTWVLDANNEVTGTLALYAQTKWQIRYEFEPTDPPSFFSFNNSLTNNYMKPVNRKFIESIGGIHFFGVSRETFIWNGAFDPSEMLLGEGGFIMLTKRDSYYSSAKTMLNRIKIFFQTQQTVKAALFEDGLIAQTNIPTTYIYRFWADPAKRTLMHKKNGFGTIGLQLNLDHNTNRVKALLDSDFRNALYFAIDRNDVLRLVGLDTSFPVVTWTAFGQAKTSDGIAVEQWFENTDVKMKDDKSYPLQSFTYQDHLAKSYTFENVDRSDNNFSLETARYYMDLYKKRNPNVSKVTMQYVHDSSEQHIKAGVAFQDLINKAFGGFVEIEIKGYPANVYEQFRAEGKFDLAYTNFDYFGTEYDSYIKTFIFPDGINLEDQKTIGFRQNAAGSWTYQNYFFDLENYPGGSIEEETRKRLDISEKHWNKIKELSVHQLIKDADGNNIFETDEQFKDRVNSFFAYQFTDAEKAEGWTEKENFALAASYEKIIKDAAPVIPLMEIDTEWEVSRIGGVSNTYTYSLQFAYDFNFPPVPGLPTKPSN